MRTFNITLQTFVKIGQVNWRATATETEGEDGFRAKVISDGLTAELAYNQLIYRLIELTSGKSE